jgi:hypothetical protein
VYIVLWDYQELRFEKQRETESYQEFEQRAGNKKGTCLMNMNEYLHIIYYYVYLSCYYVTNKHNNNKGD